ncbi:hypothetical protein FIBSPDRAFT_951467 [Athelia psychrophila]|uniref:BTB domain-containing protein n=1 Tax=Athelia psychrophila TaxID=1759441 RepID=A0A166MNY0_9AGAM|nr:hypothetical protein FIBSPDRAFT_951467 [Fibularhizoctonia sp. CBS 109695]
MALCCSCTPSPFDLTITEAPDYARHPRYYFEDGNIVFLVEDTLYNMHRYLFARDSTHFRTILRDNGASDPCVISDVSCTEFDEFLAILYPTDFRQPSKRTTAQWTSILHLAAKWGFENIKLLSIDNLTADATPIDKVVLGRRYGITDWLPGAYEAVCTRADPLTMEEGMKLGVEDTVRISAARQLYGIGEARHETKYLAGDLGEIFKLGKPSVGSISPMDGDGDPQFPEEFTAGSKVFFLGEHAYGVVGQISATTESTLSAVLVFFPSDKATNEKFKSIVDSRISSQYFSSFKAVELAGLTERALSRITSSFMVLAAGGKEVNVGLGLRFEAKALKVIDYTRKNDRFWEFSQKTVDLLKDYKAKFPQIFRHLEWDDMVRASDLFDDDADAKVQEVKVWLKDQGVQDFEHVSIFVDQLNKDTVGEIEKLADAVTAQKSQSATKKAIVTGIPHQAVLKPAQAVYRLQHQSFALGDRVTMVQDSGVVPPSTKGIVIGLSAKSMDVVWDVLFRSGVTLSDRCSQYRGSTVKFDSCLNLTNPQFIAPTNLTGPTPARRELVARQERMTSFI